MEMKPTAILLLHCPDQQGIISEVTKFITDNKGNIVYLDQYVDKQDGMFFMRIEWELDGFLIPRDKLYDYIIRDINPEISDDEARIVTVRDILVKTYKPSARGMVSYNAAEKQEAYERIEKIKQKIDDGTDFDVIAEGVENEDTKIEYSFGRGVMPPSYEDAAFNLVVGQVSDIVET